MNIEEIAFKNVEELICLRNISLLAIIDFLQKDRKECLNQFAKTHNESIEILKENKELKKQLHDASIQIQELIERDIWCPSNCDKLKELRKQYCERTDCSGRIGNSKKVEELQQENEKLKKELKDEEQWRIKIASENDQNVKECLSLIKKKKKYESQRKQFIKYLEDEINKIEPKGTSINYNCEYDSEDDYIIAIEEQSKLITLKRILSAYKEIIGVPDERSM